MAEQYVPRRLAAILAADVAGYSRLTGADEEGTLARLRSLRQEVIDPAFARHHGRIVKTTGDGLLVEFASVVDAARAAIEMQRDIALGNAAVAPEQRIEFRIGIHLGDIVVEDDDILGDGVNIAARLEGIAPSGGICVSEDAWRQVEGKVAAQFTDIGEPPLKNIARPIRVFRIDPSDGTVAAPAAAERPLSANASIAVLPFANLSGDAEQDYFADGMVEDIITGLARIKWLFVIARNSSFVYKGKVVDMKQVGRELGVRYVLEGSVRKAGNRVRITGQLIEAATGRHLWAERYDRPLDDIFALQDEITLSVVGAIEPSLRHAEIERVTRKRTENLDAYDLKMRALALLSTITHEDATQAIGFLERALALDPHCAGAHALMALGYRTRYGTPGGTDEDRDAAIRNARAEIALGSDDATALALAGLVLSQIGNDGATGLRLFDRALALSPSNNIALGASAVTLAWIGQIDLAVERAELARRLSPFDPMSFLPNLALAIAHFQAGRFAESADAARRAADINPQFPMAEALYAAALVRLGRNAEAHEVAQRIIAADPTFSLGERTRHMGVPPPLFAPFIAAMHEAGLPE